jgi:hypothetical protein
MLRLAAAILIWVLLSVPIAAQSGRATYQYKNLTGAGTSTLKSSPGFLHSVCTNTAANTATVTLYDGLTASGTAIGKVTSFTSLTGCAVMDVAYWTGLTAVVAGGSPDLTVTFQ